MRFLRDPTVRVVCPDLLWLALIRANWGLDFRTTSGPNPPIDSILWLGLP